MATRRYAAISQADVAGRRYAPGAAFEADPEHEDIARQLGYSVRDLDADAKGPYEPSKPRGQHKRRDMRAEK